MAEMKVGYKQTEIGVIPEDWDCYTIGDLITFSGGSQPPRETFSNYKKSEYIRLIQIRDYKTDEHKTYVPKKLAKKFCSKEDIMIGRYGPPIFQILRGLEGAYNVALIKAIPSHKLDRQFMYYFLCQNDLFLFVEALSQRSSGQTGIELPALRNYPFPLPQLEEQKQIATALSDIDRLIEALSQLIAKKRDMKTAVMQQLLTGKKRLSGFDGEWKEKTLKEIAPLQRGFDLPKSQIEKGSIPVAYSNGIMAYHNKAMVKGPGVYTGRSGTIGKVNYIASDYWPHNTSLWVTTFFDNDRKFIFYLYSFIGFARFSSGSGVPTLNRNDAHDYRCFIPHPKEQTAIAAILSDIDIEIDALEQRLEKARSLKTGMMQELLTGKTRLIKSDKKQEAA